MSLVPDYDESSSSSSSSTNFSQDISSIQKDEANKEKLPIPNFLNVAASRDRLIPSNGSSVFKNPFTEAENAKEAMLQKHVKMVDSKNSIMINGKKICWNYRKGRCRYGHNCKYAHDSDLQKSAEQIQAENRIQQTVILQQGDLPQASVEEILRIKEESILAQKKKKRPGLSRGLIPSKRVMRNYQNEKRKRKLP